jgi:hypothetical protein
MDEDRSILAMVARRITIMEKTKMCRKRRQRGYDNPIRYDGLRAAASGIVEFPSICRHLTPFPGEESSGHRVDIADISSML